MGRKRTIPDAECQRCHKTFRPQARTTKYCSNACARKGMWAEGGARRKLHPPTTLTCGMCGGTWESTQPTQEPKYCSYKCSVEARSGERNNRYNGGKHVLPDGRVMVATDDGRFIWRSRYLMEKHLGRRLAFDEVVHHINGDGTDDRLENLQLLSRAEHINVHREDLQAGQRAAAIRAAKKPLKAAA